MIPSEQNRTGYPHIDRPWQKYFKQELFDGGYPEGSVYDYVYEMNKDRLNETAISYFGKKISYGNLFGRVDRCAKALINVGIKKGAIVSICMLMCPEVAELLLAINRIGAISNFIPVNSTAQEIKKSLLLVESSIVFVSDMVEKAVKEASEGTAISRIICVSATNSAPWYIRLLTKNISSCEAYNNFLQVSNDVGIPSLCVNADDVAVLEYTSGTTGESKACMLTNRSLNNAGYHDNRTEGLFDLHSGQTILASIPPFLAFGLVMNVIMPLQVGLELIMIPDPSPESVAKAVVKHKPNHIVTGPTQVDVIVELATQKKLNMSFIRTLCCGGDKLDDNWVNKINNWLSTNGASHRLTNGYGMTETSALFAECPDVTDFMIPIYLNNVMVLDSDTNECLKFGEIGEICVSGPGLMKGYYKKEKETSEVFFDKDGITWMKTGDLGYVGENGEFVITGRIKRIFWGMGSDQIVYRIYPMAIEEVVSKCELVKHCAVIGKRNGNLGYLPILYIVPIEGSSKDEIEKGVMDLCKDNLKENSYPAQIIFIEKLPITKAGKVDYRKLEEMCE